MKIPILNIYILTAKSLREKQEDTAIATRRMTVKLFEGLLYENTSLREEVAELKRKGEKK